MQILQIVISPFALVLTSKLVSSEAKTLARLEEFIYSISIVNSWVDQSESMKLFIHYWTQQQIYL